MVSLQTTSGLHMAGSWQQRSAQRGTGCGGMVLPVGTLTVSVVASLSPVPRHERMQRRQNACSHASSPNLRALGGCWPTTTSRQMPHCGARGRTAQAAAGIAHDGLLYTVQSRRRAARHHMWGAQARPC